MSVLREVTSVQRSWDTGRSRPVELQRLNLACGHVAERRSPPGLPIDPTHWRCLDCAGEGEFQPPIPHLSG